MLVHFVRKSFVKTCIFIENIFKMDIGMFASDISFSSKPILTQVFVRILGKIQINCYVACSILLNVAIIIVCHLYWCLSEDVCDLVTSSQLHCVPGAGPSGPMSRINHHNT